MRSVPMLLLAVGLALGPMPAASAAPASELVASGRFEGRSQHTARGGVSILRTAGGTLLVLEGDFAFDGAPDPKLGFGKDGYRRETLFTPLASNTGAQVYRIPGEIDPEAFDQVWIWCEKFDVPLGVAKLR